MTSQQLIRSAALALAATFVLWTVAVQAADRDKAAEKVALKECPAAVQDTIKARIEGATIVGIEKDTENGDVEYTVTVKKDKKERDLFVGEDGEFRGWEETVALKDCPAPVQKTVKA